MHWGWGFGGFGMIFWWLIIIALVVALFYGRGSRGGSEGRPYYASGKAVEILKERYAKGELTEEEYKKMRQDIKE